MGNEYSYGCNGCYTGCGGCRPMGCGSTCYRPTMGCGQSCCQPMMSGCCTSNPYHRIGYSGMCNTGCYSSGCGTTGYFSSGCGTTGYYSSGCGSCGTGMIMGSNPMITSVPSSTTPAASTPAPTPAPSKISAIELKPLGAQV